MDELYNTDTEIINNDNNDDKLKIENDIRTSIYDDFIFNPESNKYFNLNKIMSFDFKKLNYTNVLIYTLIGYSVFKLLK